MSENSQAPMTVDAVASGTKKNSQKIALLPIASKFGFIFIFERND